MHILNVFLFVCSISVAGATLGDIVPVQNARQLLLKKERLAALKLLRESLTDEANAQHKPLLIKELKNAKTIFFTNEGQKLFEQAESARYKDDARAATTYLEALKLEPYHYGILEGLILFHLSKDDCQAAQPYLTQIKEMDDAADETELIDFLVRSCISKTEVVLTVRDFASSDFRVYERTFRAKTLYSNSQFDQAIRYADEAIQLNGNYPTPFYWAWKSRVAEGFADQAQEKAERFIELCHTDNVSLRRQYRFDPWICRGVEEVREYLNNFEKGAAK